MSDPSRVELPIPEEARPRLPDDAWAAFIAAMRSAAEAGMPAEAPALGLRAAAPHIARAAQVQVLREMADELDAEVSRAYLDDDRMSDAADRVRDRANQIERGE